MFKEFFLFEIKQGFKKPLVYVFFIINFALLFAATISENISVTGIFGNINVNAPHVIMTSALMLSLIGIFMTTAIITSAMLRDFNSNYDGILFSTPLSKIGYLGGRFAGAYILSLLPYIGAFAGIALASASPLVPEAQAVGFTFIPYLNAFMLIIIPNTFLIAAIVFMCTALTRSTIMSFLGALLVLVIYLMMSSFASDLSSEQLVILSDPLGLNSYNVLTKYWTADERNNLIMPIAGLFLTNRIIWTLAGSLFLLFTYYKFSFSKKDKRKKTSAKNNSTKVLAAIPQFIKKEPLPIVNITEPQKAQWHQLWSLFKMEFWGIIKSTAFIIIVLIGIANMFSAIPFASMRYGTSNFPLTYLVIEAIRNSFYLFLVAIILFYSGAVIWRERDYNFSELVNVSPQLTWVTFGSKLLALIGIVFFILNIAIGVGILNQLMSGYSNFEFGIYVREFLVFDLMKFIVIIILSMFIHTMVNNKYLGYFLFLLTLLLFQFGPQALEIKSHLVSYGSTPSYIYSDMNQWGIYSAALSWFHTYWMLFALLLVIVSILFTVRGKAANFRKRIAIAKHRFSGSMIPITLVLGLLWITTASFLFYQTQIKNPETDTSAQEISQVKYEQQYKQFEHIPQPRITAVQYDINLAPMEKRYAVKALVTAKNKTDKAIDNLHFSMSESLDQKLTISGATLETEDPIAHYNIYKLLHPLQPGDSMTFQVDIEHKTIGIENEISSTDLVENGSFLSNFKIMPVIGYSSSAEIEDKKTREKYHLPAKQNVALLHEHCSQACQNSYISHDADWVNVSSTISTDLDQIAIAPGTLIKEWEENNRKYFYYELKQPVLNFYTFISGRYEVLRKKWYSNDGKTVDIEVYYHPVHDFNVENMQKAVEASLDYYTQNFGNYPHEQARIIEFPRYKSFAQAFPGTMPYSESMGFIANLEQEASIDMVFYTVAHEMAHQWWAHQVIGADVQGATMLSESFAQYSALMVMKKAYGSIKMNQFMRYEMDKYLRGRGQEMQKELPLMFNEDQAYIHYGKGSVVMYALQNYIGEEKVNEALYKFKEAVAYQEAPYTTSLEVLTYLEAVTPDSLKYLLDDMFRNITLYSNRTSAATYNQLSDGKYLVSVSVEIAKYRADSLGKETLIEHDDFIDIGLFSAEKAKGTKYGKPIILERHRIAAKDTTFEFIVDELPAKAGIDPNYLLIDRFPEDNVRDVEME